MEFTIDEILLLYFLFPNIAGITFLYIQKGPSGPFLVRVK